MAAGLTDHTWTVDCQGASDSRCTLQQHSFAHLRQQPPHLDAHIRYPRPFTLDDVSVALDPWSRYNAVAQHPTDTTRTSFAQMGAQMGRDPIYASA